MFRCDGYAWLVAAFGGSFLPWLFTSCRVASAPHGVQRVCLQARHRVLPTTSVPPSSGPRLYSSITVWFSLVVSPVYAVPVATDHLTILVQLCSSSVDDHDIIQHCSRQLWLLVCMGDATSNLGASSWYLVEACGLLDRGPSLYPSGTTQIQSGCFSSVSLWW